MPSAECLLEKILLLRLSAHSVPVLNLLVGIDQFVPGGSVPPAEFSDERPCSHLYVSGIVAALRLSAHLVPVLDLLVGIAQVIPGSGVPRLQLHCPPVVLHCEL